MRHLLLSTEIQSGEIVRLESRDFHYLAHVLRLKNGDRFDLLDAGGRSFSARVTLVGDDFLEAITESASHDPVVGPGWCRQVTIYQAVPKGRRFDDIIRQTIQAGATSIVPVVTDRTIARVSDSERGKLERWQRVAREAVQQSGGHEPVQVRSPLRLRDLNAAEGGLSLFLHPEAIAQRTLHGYLDRVPRLVEIVVGPEGGFTAEETALLTGRGFRPLYLGPRVLRTETAAVFTLGAVQILLQERGSWWLTE